MYKIRVDTVTVGTSTPLATTYIGAHSTALIGEVALHAHGDLLFELGEDVHRRVDDLVC